MLAGGEPDLGGALFFFIFYFVCCVRLVFFLVPGIVCRIFSGGARQR